MCSAPMFKFPTIVVSIGDVFMASKSLERTDRMIEGERLTVTDMRLYSTVADIQNLCRVW